MAAINLPATPAVRVLPGASLRLAAINPDTTDPYESKKKAEKRLAELRKQLSDLQENLYAEHRQSLLLVFQAIDTGGKDGAIRKLLTGLQYVPRVLVTDKAQESRSYGQPPTRRILWVGDQLSVHAP